MPARSLLRSEGPHARQIFSSLDLRTNVEHSGARNNARRAQRKPEIKSADDWKVRVAAVRHVAQTTLRRRWQKERKDRRYEWSTQVAVPSWARENRHANRPALRCRSAKRRH